MKDAFILDAVRTPIGRYGGGLSGVRADDLAALPIRELLARNPQVPAEGIEDVILGCANQAGEDNRNIARMAGLLAGLPATVPGQTVNRLCASGLSAVVQAAHAVRLGEGELFIAGGVEHMTRAPLVMGKAANAYDRSQKIYDTTIGWRFVNPAFAEVWGTDGMGETAENLAELYNISREDQDAFALRSQQKTAAAQQNGRLALEIMAIEVPQKKGPATRIERDEFPRNDTTIAALSKLRPAFRENGTVTAGNSSGINDGACAILLGDLGAAKACGLKPKARIVSTAVSGVEPRIMGIGPVEAARKALNRAGIDFNDLSVIELNEAFAAQSLACIREWGLSDTDERINPNGGAISLGHPLGMSGARLIATACYELEQKNGRYALCTLCVGVGQGAAVILERV